MPAQAPPANGSAPTSPATKLSAGFRRRASAAERSEKSTPMTGRSARVSSSARKRPTWPAAPQPTSRTGPGGHAAAKRRRRSTSQGLRVSSSAKSAAYCSAMRSNAARTGSITVSGLAGPSRPRNRGVPRLRRGAPRHHGGLGGPFEAPHLLGPDPQRCAEVAEQRDRREVGEPSGARVLRRHVLDLDLQRAELALHPDPVRVEGEPGHRVDLRPRLLRSNAGQRERGQHVDVGGEGAAGVGGRPLEDQRLLAQGVEVDLLLHDPGRDGQTLRDRKSTRLNSSHLVISYAVFCLKKKKQKIIELHIKKKKKKKTKIKQKK